MAAPKPTMRRRKAPTAAALEFVEGKKAAKSRSGSGSERRKVKPKPVKKTARAPQAISSEARVPKRLYIPAEVDQALRLRAAKDGVQQSEIATEALMKFLGL